MVEIAPRTSQRSAQSEGSTLSTADNPKYLQLLRLLADILALPSKRRDHTDPVPQRRDPPPRLS